jgi:anthranilate phosphoribosyltransferase
MAEIRGAAAAMREAAVSIPTRHARAIDTCGTGGSGIPRRNVSTAAAIAVAACGQAVAKHGNRAASSRSGSADVLEALGVDISASAERVAKSLDEVGVGFLFARQLHPAMWHAGPVRAALGVRTLFNLLGPLCNPARVRRQVMGCYDPARLEPLAEALGGLGSERVFIVHGYRRGDAPSEGGSGRPGLDDLSPEGVSLVVEWREGGLRQHHLQPEDAGLEPFALAQLTGGDAEENAAAMRRVLAGSRDAADAAYRQAVQYAGGLALLVGDDEGLSALPGLCARVGEVLDDGRAAGVLQRLVAYSRGEPE